MASGDFKLNTQTGAYEAQRDGVYERQADEPVDRVRVQMRKGQAVSEADAKAFSRVGPWPGEPDENAVEQQATASAKQAAPPENKAAPAPENKAG